MDWLLYDRDLHHESLKGLQTNGYTLYEADELQTELKF